MTVNLCQHSQKMLHQKVLHPQKKAVATVKMIKYFLKIDFVEMMWVSRHFSLPTIGQTKLCFQHFKVIYLHLEEIVYFLNSAVGCIHAILNFRAKQSSHHEENQEDNLNDDIMQARLHSSSRPSDTHHSDTESKASSWYRKGDGTKEIKVHEKEAKDPAHP